MGGAELAGDDDTFLPRYDEVSALAAVSADDARASFHLPRLFRRCRTARAGAAIHHLRACANVLLPSAVACRARICADRLNGFGQTVRTSHRESAGRLTARTRCGFRSRYGLSILGTRNSVALSALPMVREPQSPAEVRVAQLPLGR